MIILYVADQRRSAEFYARVLQRAPVLDVPGMTEFALEADVLLGLMPVSGIERLLPDLPVPPSAAPGASRCELYLNVPDPESALARAVEAGARLASPVAPRDWGERAGYCIDPDGHVLAFAGQ